MSEAPKCRCGRSPTGNCMGWHALSEEEYKEKKAAFNKAKERMASRGLRVSHRTGIITVQH